MDERVKPPGAGASAGLATLLTGIFEAWKQAGIAFVILRNYEALPETTSNDIDVLVLPGDLQRAERVCVAAAQARGYRLHNRIEYASLVLFFYDPETLHQVQLDLYGGVPWRGFPTVPAKAVIAERVERGQFAVPHPVHEAAISLLGRLLQHGKVGDKYKLGIAAGFKSDAKKAIAVLSDCFGARLAELVVGQARAENWAGIEGLTGQLRRALIRRKWLRQPGATLVGLGRELMRGVRRFRRPGGMSIAVLGADGSGKSTVAALAVEKLRPTFAPGKSLQVHWKPVVFFKQRRRPTGLPNVDPHRQPPRGRIASLGYLAGHWLEYVLGSHFAFRGVLFRGGLVLIDRYYYDFLIDQRRYRLHVPHWLVRPIFRLVRQPDLVLLLDAPAEVLQERKQEVPAAETARQVAAYRVLVAGLPRGRVLDARQPAAEVAQAFTRLVLEWLEARTSRRGNSA